MCLIPNCSSCGQYVILGSLTVIFGVEQGTYWCYLEVIPNSKEF